MKLKLDENGNVVLAEVNGAKHPVYVHDDGKELPFDAAATVARIHALNAEAKNHREGKEAAEAKLKLFEGIEDPDAARKALQIVANLKDGDLVKAEKVEEIKAAARKAADEQLAAVQKNHAAELQKWKDDFARLSAQYEAELIGGNFNRSKFIAEKVATPIDMLQATFGKHFKIEDGKVVAYDKAGNKIFSRARPGDLADFDEALETIIDQYPGKEQILKATVKGGGGANGDSANTQGKPAGKWDGSLAERTQAVLARFPQLSS